MAMKMIVRVRQIDHDGFCGRDFHPTDDMVGMEARVIKAETFDLDAFDEEFGDLSYTVYTAVLPDDRVTVLMEHEVELVTFSLM
jgi:hypothetical protein